MSIILTIRHQGENNHQTLSRSSIGRAKAIQDALDQWSKYTFLKIFQGKARALSTNQLKF